MTFIYTFRTPPFILDPANPFHNVAKDRWSEQLNLVQLQGECLQSARKYQGRRGHSLESFPVDTVHSGNTSTINSIQRRGAILKRKYNSLPEESASMSTWKKVVIVGSVLAMGFAIMSGDEKK